VLASFSSSLLVTEGVALSRLVFEIIDNVRNVIHCVASRCRALMRSRQMQTVNASLMVGTERQEIRLRLTEDTLYIDKQQLSYSSSYLPQELQTDSTLLAKV